MPQHTRHPDGTRPTTEAQKSLREAKRCLRFPLRELGTGNEVTAARASQVDREGARRRRLTSEESVSVGRTPVALCEPPSGDSYLPEHQGARALLSPSAFRSPRQ